MRLLHIAAATVLVGSLITAVPPEATAQTTVTVSGATQQVSTSVRKHRASRASRAARVAKRYIGVPYRYGGSTPRGFDCSGYTKYVYGKVGRNLPRRASLQRRATTRIKHPRIGDLVFFHNRNGSVYHVGIYAGNRSVWHAPYPGKRVKREHIWTRRVSYGRA
jgi:cell wall-associated NlpC family hydrolase